MPTKRLTLLDPVKQVPDRVRGLRAVAAGDEVICQLAQEVVLAAALFGNGVHNHACWAAV